MSCQLSYKDILISIHVLIFGERIYLVKVLALWTVLCRSLTVTEISVLCSI